MAPIHEPPRVNVQTSVPVEPSSPDTPVLTSADSLTAVSKDDARALGRLTGPTDGRPISVTARNVQSTQHNQLLNHPEEDKEVKIVGKIVTVSGTNVEEIPYVCRSPDGHLNVYIPLNYETSPVALLEVLRQAGFSEINLYDLLQIADQKSDGNYAFDSEESLSKLSQYLDKAVSTDGKLLLELAKSNYEVLASADKSLLSDFAFMYSAAQIDWRVIAYASESIRSNKDRMRFFVQFSGLSLKYATPNVQSDPNVAFMAVHQNAGALLFVDKQTVVKDLQLEGKIVYEALHNLKAVASYVLYEIVSDLMIKDGQYVDKNGEERPAKELLEDFAMKAFAANFNVYPYIKDDLAGYLPAGTEQDYEEIVKGLAEFGIEHPDRIKNSETARAVIDCRRKLIEGGEFPKDKPLAVVIAGKADHNGVFATNCLIDQLVEMGYRVAYFEVRDEKEAYAALKLATKNGKNHADLLVMRGHGTGSTITLDKTDEKIFLLPKTKTIGVEDKEVMKAQRWAKYLSKKSVVIIDSCLGGVNGEKGENVVNAMHEVFPHSTIYGSYKSFHSLQLKEDRQLAIMAMPTFKLGKKSFEVDWTSFKIGSVPSIGDVAFDGTEAYAIGPDSPDAKNMLGIAFSMSQEQ